MYRPESFGEALTPLDRRLLAADRAGFFARVPPSEARAIDAALRLLGDAVKRRTAKEFEEAVGAADYAERHRQLLALQTLRDLAKSARSAAHRCAAVRGHLAAATDGQAPALRAFL